MSPYLAAKMGIRYSFLFGLFLCNISILSAYYIVYVDKILYPQQKYKYEILHHFSEPLLLAENDNDSDNDENEHEHKNGHDKKIENEVISINARNKLKFLINDINQNENEIQININNDDNEIMEEGKEKKEEIDKSEEISLIDLISGEKDDNIGNENENETKIREKKFSSIDEELKLFDDENNNNNNNNNNNIVEEIEDGSYNKKDTDFVLNEILKKIHINDDDNDNDKIQKGQIKDFITTLSPIRQIYEITEKKKANGHGHENKNESNTKFEEIDVNEGLKFSKKSIELFSVFKFSRLFWTLTMSSLVVYGKYVHMYIYTYTYT